MPQCKTVYVVWRRPGGKRRNLPSSPREGQASERRHRHQACAEGDHTDI